MRKLIATIIASLMLLLTASNVSSDVECERDGKLTIHHTISGSDWRILEDCIDGMESRTLRILLDSNGGSADATRIMGTYLQEWKSKGSDYKIITEIPRWAASGAAIVFLFGDERIMHKNAKVFFHEVMFRDPKGNDVTMYMKDVDNYKFYADNMNQWQRDLLKTHTGMSDEELVEWMNGTDGVTIDAETALAMGIATKII